MYDLTKNRLFLKRVVNKDIVFPNDLYVGKTIVVYSRQLKIIDYADLFTKNKFESISKSYNILFINFKSFTKFLTEINKYKASFHFKAIKSVKINDQIQQFIKIENTNEMLIMCEFVGSKDIESAFNECNSNNNGDFNGMICNENDKQLIKQIAESATTAILSEDKVSSLCLIKPHALSMAASIINDILNEGFYITAITTKKLTRSEAKDFYEIYNGVIKEYNYLLEQLLSGSVIALQIHCNSIDIDSDNNHNNNNKENGNQINTNNTFNEFRDFVGPKDPEIAKYIRPHTLRAKYGVDRVQNGIHCTDLQEDGHLESKFFFQIIS